VIVLEVPRRDAPSTRGLGAEVPVDVFQGCEEASERIPEIRRAALTRKEIAVTELAGARDDGGAQGPVFLGSLGPGEFVRFIDPQRESHVMFS